MAETKKMSDKPQETVLKAKQEAFCVAYTTIGSETFSDGTKSALEAGYAEDSARTQAWRMLRRETIKKRIRELYDKNMEENMVTVGSVLANLAHDRQMARKHNQYGVAKACTELEGKYLALFTDRLVNVDPEKKRERQEFLQSEQEELNRLAVIRAGELSKGEGTIINLGEQEAG